MIYKKILKFFSIEMSDRRNKRINYEYEKLQQNNINFDRQDDYFIIQFNGPSNIEFSDQVFKVKCVFTNEYPLHHKYIR